MGFSENKDLVEIPDDLVGKSVQDVGSNEYRRGVPETGEESRHVTEDPVG